MTTAAPAPVESPASEVPQEAPAKRPFLASIYDVVFRLGCNLRLAPPMLMLVMVGCFAGMFVDQTKTFEEHAREWAKVPWKYQLYTALELHDVFHSWWFSTLLLLLAMQLVAIKIERLPRILLDIWHPERTMPPRRDKLMKWKGSFTVPNAQVFQEALLKGLGRTTKPVISQEGSTTYIFAEKHRYGRTGAYVIHVALLTIIFSSIVTSTLGFDGTVGVVEGNSNRYAFGRGPAGLRFRKDLGFLVACSDFRLKQFVDGAPMDFESDLSIVDQGKVVARKTIQVNDPLEYGGFIFYQASYQPVPGDDRVQLAIGRPGGGAKTMFNVTPGTPISIPGTDTRFTPLEIIPEYASFGPALRVQQVKEGQAPTSFLVFQNYPNFDEEVRRGDFALHFKGADKTYMTGIQVARAPGVEIVFAGFALMFVGLFMAFFMNHRRYWARVEQNADGSARVTVAGQARKHQPVFDEEFKTLLDGLAALPGVKQV